MTEQAQIERINVLSATARTSWLALLAFLAYIGITLLAVEDADFFVPSRRTELPLVDISIPTFSFFLFAPPLAAALYIYLHIHLLRLWDALADAPATIDGHPLGEHLHPWIAKDYALGLKGDGSLRPRPLRTLGNLASVVLVWAACPAVLALFWWRSATARDDLLTLAIAFSFFLALRAGLITLWHFRARMKRRGWGDAWDGRWWKLPLLWSVAVLLVLVSWLRTEAGLDHYANRAIDLWEAVSGRPFAPGSRRKGDGKDPQALQEEWVAARRWIPTLATFTFTAETYPFSLWLRPAGRVAPGEIWSPLARIDLAGADLVPLPENWRARETARLAFQQAWCAREGLDAAVCNHLMDAARTLPALVQAERETWCSAHLPPSTSCAEYFVQLGQRFMAAWGEERASAVADLPKLDLSGADLRHASAQRASMVGAILSFARLEGANFTGAQMEEVDLSETHAAQADLSQAHLEGADLSGSNLQGAFLLDTRLEDADLSGALLNGAILLEAQLNEAELFEADLTGASLLDAQLENAALGSALLGGADLSGARLVRANLSKAELRETNLQLSDLRAASLQDASLRFPVKAENCWKRRVGLTVPLA